MNCLIVDDDEMSQNVVRHFVQKTDSLSLIGVCATAMEAANIMKKESIDLLLLDIEMPEMSGYDLLDSFAENPPEIILITAKAEYAATAFNYQVADYLVKPIIYSRFLKAISRAEEKFSQSAKNETSEEVYVRSDSKIVKVRFDEILYVEALADYITIFTKDNKYIVHSTMKGFQSRLPVKNFARIHRSFIVNINKVEAIENLFVTIMKRQIPIGISFKEAFMKRLNFL